MAYIETRTLTNGEKSHQVVWTVNTTGKRVRRKETFATRGDAERWLGLLEASGADVALRALNEASCHAQHQPQRTIRLHHLPGSKRKMGHI